MITTATHIPEIITNIAFEKAPINCETTTSDNIVSSWFASWNTKNEKWMKKSLQVNEANWQYIGKIKDNYVKTKKNNQYHYYNIEMNITTHEFKLKLQW